MKREDLIALTKELLSLDDLSGRQADLSLLKREWRRLANHEDETFFERSLTDEFNRVYEELAKKEGSLTVSPVDEKKALIEAMKALENVENIKKVINDKNEIEKSFKAAGRTSKEQDDELWAAFREAKAVIEAKVNTHFETVRNGLADKKAKKEAIIEEAKKALEIKNIKEASNKFDALMEQWKAVGFAGKQFDESLWTDFSAVRKEFNTKRRAYYANLEVEFKARAVKKEELIKKVKKFVADCEFTQEELKIIKDFQNEWKAIGFSGKEAEDSLWNEFDAAIKQYFEEKKFYTN